MVSLIYEGRRITKWAAALIEIADSRFQQNLIQQAKAAGKLKGDYQLPDKARQNNSEELKNKMEPYCTEGLFAPFPFGTELTDVEIRLGKALKSLKKKSQSKLAMAQALLSAISLYQ